MDLTEAIVLALLQGITEFLPISSSAHLILVPQFLDWDDQGLAFDVAVHLGTLTAVIVYFRHELSAVWWSWLGELRGEVAESADARLGWWVIVATIPAGIAGLLFRDVINDELRSPVVIAISTALFGVLLWVADRRRRAGQDEYSLTLVQVLIIGCAQALALVPGTSRSGITITAGLALGLSRPAAARFAFLLAIPIIALASLLELWQLLSDPEPVQWLPIVAGVVVSAISAYFCIRLFLKALEKIGMLPFMIYRLLLAALIWVSFT